MTFGLKERHILAVMGFLGMLNVYFTRLNLSMGIVAMVGRQPTVLSAGNNESMCEARYDLHYWR